MSFTFVKNKMFYQIFQDFLFFLQKQIELHFFDILFMNNYRLQLKPNSNNFIKSLDGTNNRHKGFVS